MGKTGASSCRSKQDSRCCKGETKPCNIDIKLSLFFFPPISLHSFHHSQPRFPHISEAAKGPRNVKSVMQAELLPLRLCLCRIKDMCVTVWKVRKEGRKRNTLWCYKYRQSCARRVFFCLFVFYRVFFSSNSKFWSFILFSSEMPWIQKIMSVTILNHDLLMSENLKHMDTVHNNGKHFNWKERKYFRKMKRKMEKWNCWVSKKWNRTRNRNKAKWKVTNYINICLLQSQFHCIHRGRDHIPNY